MASSSYHYNQYKYYQWEQNRFDSWLTELNNIEKSFRNKTYTGQYDDVNRKIRKCKTDKDESLNGDSRFTVNLTYLDSAKEPSTDCDSDLSVAYQCILQEINRIAGRRQEAMENKERHFREYRKALAREASSCPI